MEKDIKQFCDTHRQNGSTEWLIQSAILDPRITIICLSLELAEELHYRYVRTAHSLPWFKRWMWKRRVKKYGTAHFTSLNHASLMNIQRPYVFDNAALQK